MCGICCLLIQNDGKEFDDLKHCMKYGQICHRGPNISVTKEVVADTNTLTLTGHVLHLRGQLTPQPLQHDNGDLLLWNGEIFGGIEVEAGENDTEVLLQTLTKKLSCQHILNTMAAIQGPWSFLYWQEATKQLFFGRDMFGRRSLLWHLPKTANDVFLLSSVRLKDYEFEEVPSVGIFSLKIESETVTMMMYPRDDAVWPGTTVLVKTSNPQQFCIGNLLAQNFKFEFAGAQVVPMSIPKLNKELLVNNQNQETKCDRNGDNKESFSTGDNCELNSSERSKDSKVQAGAEKLDIPSNTSILKKKVDISNTEIDDPKKFLHSILQNDTIMNKLSDHLIDVLFKAVTCRVYNQVDLNTKPCDQCKKDGKCRKWIKKNANNVNKISCVSETNEQCSIHETDIREVNSETQENSCHDNPTSTEYNISVVTSNQGGNNSKICENSSEKYPSDGIESKSSLHTEESNLQDSIAGCSKVTKESNVQDSIAGCSKVTEESNVQDSITGCAKVAVLFSGGIDSSVITALVDKCLPEDEPVDLLNVAFEQQVKPQQKKKGQRSQGESSQSSWNVPDRITGYTALQELNPNRQWNFVEINVTIKELQTLRLNHIQHLLYPLETVLDDSIGCAVWFASRGQGILGNTEQVGIPYQSTAKVILCGMGADEQLAGYSRHRVKFKEYGWQGLLDEIELEVNRISARNLGRDDRIITDHGKESRFPFLDENVVNFLQRLPVQHKANLSLPRGVGEKLLLRLCAIKLGLVNTATFPKRAIQFGSRIAKTENNKEKGSDKCQRLN